jgi:hypothetical protein
MHPTPLLCRHQLFSLVKLKCFDETKRSLQTNFLRGTLLSEFKIYFQACVVGLDYAAVTADSQFFKQRVLL